VWLTEEAAERDDHKATIRYAQRIIDLEPTDEAAVRIQMRAHLALGDRAAALRAYHRCAEALERDLAVAPGEAHFVAVECASPDLAHEKRFGDGRQVQVRRVRYVCR
jgi:DNA-binding SARP family transcriptional activator